MKKAIILILTFFAFGLTASSQCFNHLSIGVDLGTDGVGLELSAPIGKRLILRAGYGAAFGLIGISPFEVSVPEHPGNSSSPNVSVPVRFALGKNEGHLKAAYYPFKNSIYFTLGFFLGSSRFMQLSLNGMPSDYDIVGLDVDGYLVRAHDGKLKAALCAPGIGGASFAVKPYAGFGYGRPVNAGKRVTFTVELGVQYQGRPGVWARGEGITGRTKNVQITGEQLEALSKFEHYARFMSFWPVLQAGLHIRLF